MYTIMLVLAIFLIITYMGIYLDCRRIDGMNPFIWVIVVTALGFFGVILYLVKRRGVTNSQ